MNMAIWHKDLTRRKSIIIRKSTTLAKREEHKVVLCIRMQVFNLGQRLPRSQRRRDDEEKTNYSWTRS